jgi:hypothetical protein
MLIMFSHGLFCPVSGISTKHDSEAKRPKFIHKYWEVSKPDLLIFSDLVKDAVPTLYHKNQLCRTQFVSRILIFSLSFFLSFFQHAGNQRGRILDFISHPNFEQSHPKNTKVKRVLG